MKSIPISKFKATCLAVLETVNRTGEPILITRRGHPVAEVVPPSRPAEQDRRLGVLVGRGRIAGDIMEPPLGPSDWESLSD